MGDAHKRDLLFQLRRRVQPCRMEKPTQVDDAGAVHLQCFDRRAARPGQPDDEREVVTPLEMIAPVLPARMKKRDTFADDGVQCLGLCVFVAVASVTGKS